MSRNFTPDDLFKKQLSEMPFEPSDATWQKIESALQADKDDKKDKRRWVLILLLVLVTGGAAWFALQQTGKSTGKQITGSAQTVPGTKAGSAPDQNRITPAHKDLTSGTAQSEEKSGYPSVSGTETRNNTAAASTATSSLQQTQFIQQTKTVAPDKAIFTTRRAGTQKTRTNQAPREKNPGQPFVANKPAPAANEKADPATGIAMKTKNSEPPVIAPAPAVTPEPSQTTTGNKDLAKDAPQQTAKSENPRRNNNTEFFINGGVAIASPFNKTGYYGGVLMTRTTKDNKHFYAGISLVSHKLEHQYISADKMNSPSLPVTTDAVVDGMTSLRLSAGYLFPLNGKGHSPNSFFMAGFEPSYAIHLRTLYYESPGQPAILNSPIMEKAVNRFNLFFTAGWMKTFKPGIGVSLKAGYGLIPITDRAFYNRTLKNNNIKSLEVGLQYRISKK